MNSTPEGERFRISFFGRRNAGKSSLINALCGQQVSIVSDVPGTTTDPVRKAVEMLPLGPVLFVDTAGLDDDDAEVGALRIKRAGEEMRKSDFAVLVADGRCGIDGFAEEIASRLRAAGVPFAAVVNKIDLCGDPDGAVLEASRRLKVKALGVSALTGAGVDELKKSLSEMKSGVASGLRIVGDRLSPGDVVVLVTPIDAAAPKGRLILPQQQTIRDVLDSNAAAIVTQTDGLEKVLASLKNPPKMVITDSQAFAEVRSIVPASVELTSFSILFARYKGDYEVQKTGAETLDHLRDGDRVLVAEGCTHRRQCGDIGTQKIPAWMLEKTGKKLVFEFVSGNAWPEDLSPYSLVVHCGGCMLPRREMRRRIDAAVKAGVPISNYGILIAKLRGVEL